MTDIARIGIQVETSGIEKGISSLNKLQQAAAGVTTASARMSGTIQAANVGVASSAVSAAQAQLTSAEAILKRVRNQQSATKADKDAAAAARDGAKQQLKAALADQERANQLLKVAAAQKAATAANRVAFAAGARVSTSGIAPSGPTLAVNNGVSNTTPRDMAPNRFNTANIAAQFQDIGVTAAMGMNPLIIAMQQGTQVAAIMNSMQSPLAGLKNAFVQILNPISLLSIGLVGLVAAGLQMVDWISVGQGLLNGLAAGLDMVAASLDYVVQGLLALGLGFLAAKAAFAAYNGVLLLTTVNYTALATSMWATAAAAVGSAARTAAAWAIAGASAVIHIRATAATALLAARQFIATGAAAIAAGARMALAWAIGMAPITIFIGLIAAVTLAVTMFRDELKDLIGFDVLEAIKTGINKTIGFFFGMFEGIWAMAQNLIAKLKGQEGLPSIGEAFSQAMDGALDRDYVGMIGEGASKAADALRKAAVGLGAGADGKAGAEKKDPYAEIVAGANRRIETLKAEQAALGMTEEAAAILKYQTDLLNDATQKKIDLDVIDVATGKTRRQTLEELGAEMGRIEAQTKRNAEAMEFAKSATRGFFQDMKQGLIEGKSLWESFGNAVTNVLNKILDKMLETGVEGLFNGGGGGNLLSSLLSFGGSGGAPIPGGIGPSQGTNGIFSSIAGAFGFAKGGAFTNSVVNGTTPFAFAGGGAFGVMGEAGPEAVMPLHRGPDGSLGVKMAGGGGGGTAVIININNNSNSQVSTQQRQTSNGLEIDVMVDQMVSQKISDQGSDTNRSLQARDSRRLISR